MYFKRSKKYFSIKKKKKQPYLYCSPLLPLSELSYYYSWLLLTEIPGIYALFYLIYLPKILHSINCKVSSL